MFALPLNSMSVKIDDIDVDHKIEYNMNERCRRLKWFDCDEFEKSNQFFHPFYVISSESEEDFWRFFIVAKTMRWKEKMKMKTL